MRAFVLFLTSCLLFDGAVQACTVWGAIEHDAILIAKNRDFYPANQRWEEHDGDHHRYFGLYGDNEYDKNYTLKMGLNDAGLVVFMTFASTIPPDQRKGKTPYYKLMETMLGSYDSIDSVYAARDWLFRDTTPINYILADRTQTMICEIGLKNVYNCQIEKRTGTTLPALFAHTNHFVQTGMAQFNLTPETDNQSSWRRYSTIFRLMEAHHDTLTFDKMIDFSLNTEATNDAPPLPSFDWPYANTYQDNSIFRTFNAHPDRRHPQHKNSDQNVSTMIASLPKDEQQPIRLYLRQIESVQDYGRQAPFVQIVHYRFARVTLNQALDDPQNIGFLDRLCIRMQGATRCHTLP